jgi:hypothetical protein
MKAARFVVRRLEARGHGVTLLDPLVIGLSLLDKMYKEHPKGAAPEPLETLAGQIRAADGVVVVTGEYNHSAPPHREPPDHSSRSGSGARRRSCVLAGAFGGVRRPHLRDMLGELGSAAIVVAARALRAGRLRRRRHAARPGVGSTHRPLPRRARVVCACARGRARARRAVLSATAGRGSCTSATS